MDYRVVRRVKLRAGKMLVPAGRGRLLAYLDGPELVAVIDLVSKTAGLNLTPWRAENQKACSAENERG
jgi:hypothetical protein